MQHKKYLALKSIIKSGKFEIKGDAIELVASLLKWYDEIEPMFIDKKKKAKDGDK